MSAASSPRDVVAELRARARAGEIEQVRHPRVTIGGLSSNALLGLIGVAFFLPLIWVLFASLDANAGAGVRIPDLSLVHYRAMGHESRLRPLYNSFYLAGMSTLISTVTGLFAGYALSRRHIPFKRTLMLLVLFMSGLPVTMLLVPTYQMFVRLDWIDSLWWTSMFIAASSLPFTIWLLKNFIDQVPRELEEAAAIEGTRNFEIVLRVVVPLGAARDPRDIARRIHQRVGRVRDPAGAELESERHARLDRDLPVPDRERPDPLRRPRGVLDPLRGAGRRALSDRLAAHLGSVHLRRRHQAMTLGRRHG